MRPVKATSSTMVPFHKVVHVGFGTLQGDYMAKPSIDELMEILNNEESQEIEILPNGEIREKGASSLWETGGKKPLTMREDLGGEYCQWLA
jgi:hypothetical protein